MAPTRKSGSVNKQLSNVNETFLDQDGGNSNRSRQSGWSKEELERFYESYQKFGKDWKRVAGVVRTKSVEMVEALYHKNRAYLSLPEGAISAVGLIARMTDPYYILEMEGSDIDEEIKDGSVLDLGTEKSTSSDSDYWNTGISREKPDFLVQAWGTKKAQDGSVLDLGTEKSTSSDSDHWNTGISREKPGDLVQAQRTKKAGASGEVDMRMKIKENEGNVKQIINVDELGSDGDREKQEIKKKHARDLGELVIVSSSDSESFGPRSERIMTVKEAKGKRKLEIDLNIAVEDESDIMEGTNVGSNGIANDSGHHEREGREEDYEDDGRLTDRSVQAFDLEILRLSDILDEWRAAKESAEWKATMRKEHKQHASWFARGVDKYCNSFSEPRREMPSVEANQETEDWPSPFSTAMNIIKERAMKLNARQENSTSDISKSASVIEWRPSKDRHRNHSKPLVPSLQDLCPNVIANNAEAIVSLEYVPDVLRNKLSQLLCDSQRMDWHFMNLLTAGSPAEICVKNCSWMTEEQLTETFEGCDTNNLTVLQLDLCGRCLPDYILRATLARSSNSLPALVKISLRGACRLSDIGLNALVASAPALRSINLGQCSLLTFSGINTVADSLGSILRELYIDDCQNIDAMRILPALKKLQHLQILSVAGIQTVCDEFVTEFITACGPNIKELVLADCGKLTDTSLKVIAETCLGLCALNLVNLKNLTDYALLYLANGCRSLQTLKLCRNAFSDEAIAAFLEASGESLKELSLNYINKVSHNTAISLAMRSRKLLSLDLSWCRKLTDEALGLIVDSCLSLRLLKLFGCTQITNAFLDGHSNALLQIIGLNMIPIGEHLNVLDSNEGPLRYP